MDEFKTKLLECIDSVGLPTGGGGTTPGDKPLRVSGVDEDLESKANLARKKNYIGFIVLSLSILVFLIFLYVVYPVYVKYERGYDITTLLKYVLGGELNGKNVSMPTPYEIVAIPLFVIILFGSGVSSLITSIKLYVGNQKYYDVIRNDYDENETYTKDDCIKQSELSITFSLIICIILSMIGSVLAYIAYRDQYNDDGFFIYAISSFMTYYISYSLGLIWSEYYIKNYTEGDNFYKCDKFFI